MSTPANPPVEPTKPNQESVLLMSMFANQQKAQLESRIAALKTKGIKDEVISEFVTPHMSLDVTTMSMADFDITAGKVKSLAQAELAISMLEKMEVKTMNLGDALDYDPTLASEVGYSEGNSLSPEEATALKDFNNMLVNGTLNSAQ